MHLVQSLAAVALLTTVSVADYVPMHKRYSYDALTNDFSYLGMLAKRDECSDAFGDNARNSNCAPSFTLCCTRDGQDYPSCDKYLGRGWCCVGDGEEDKCYVDTESDCTADSAVRCTKLAEGTDEACCPKLTTCDESLEATVDYVRCNINRSDLLIAAKASEDAKSQTATSTTAAESTTTQPASSTESKSATSTVSESAGPTSTTASPEPSSSLSGGAIGGIAVGAVAGVGLLAGLIFYLMRRNKKTKYEAANQMPQPTIAQFYDGQEYKQQGQWDQNGGYVYGSPPPPSELPVQQSTPSELDVPARPPVEMDGGYRG